MKRDEIFKTTAARASDFEFDAEVAEAFDDMIVRSVPCYLEQQSMLVEIGKKFWRRGTNVYDLGCSTGTTLINLCRGLDESACLVGYDNSLPMLEQARLKLKESGFSHRVALRCGDLGTEPLELSLGNASVVTLCWTLQFVRPLRRDNLIKLIHDSLVDGGALVVNEKVLTKNRHMNACFIDFYYEFKRRNGYSRSEILRKREALENVLVPYSVDDNLELFRRNGFEIAETCFQWYNFAGFLCVKTAP